MLAAVPAAPPPVVVAQSATSYLLAPALSGRALSWLEYPAGRARSVDAAWRRAGDRLLVADGRGRRAKVMYDGGCRGDAGCASAGAPSVSGDSAVFSVAAAADGSGYLAAARPGSTLTRLLVRGEDGQRGPGTYSAGAGAAVWALDGNVLLRSLTDDGVLATRISAAEATGGRVFAVARGGRSRPGSAARARRSRSLRRRTARRRYRCSRRRARAGASDRSPCSATAASQSCSCSSAERAGAPC